MKYLLLFCLGLLALVPDSWADEQVRRVQEELRKRNLYFGELDGRKTEETTGAVRRFQARKGLAASGDLTAATLHSLEIPTDAVDKDEWPDEPVLKSDAARQLLESDRRMLEEASEREPPPPVAQGPEPKIPGAGEGPALDSRAAGAPTTNTVPADPPPCTPGKTPHDQTTQVTDFVRDYLQACETNNLEAEMRFYADRMDYFDHGSVGRDFVARDVQRFYKQWPQRQYQLLELHLAPTSGGGLEAVFQISFRYHGKKDVAGCTINHFRLAPQAGGLRFVAMKEQRLRK